MVYGRWRWKVPEDMFPSKRLVEYLCVRSGP